RGPGRSPAAGGGGASGGRARVGGLARRLAPTPAAPRPRALRHGRSTPPGRRRLALRCSPGRARPERNAGRAPEGRGTVGSAAMAADGSLDGKAVLITGAARGIGAATARLAAGHGARLSLVAFEPDE